MTCAETPQRGSGGYWTRLAAVMVASTVALGALSGAMNPSSTRVTVLHVAVSSLALGGLAGIIVPRVRRHARDGLGSAMGMDAAGAARRRGARHRARLRRAGDAGPP